MAEFIDIKFYNNLNMTEFIRLFLFRKTCFWRVFYNLKIFLNNSTHAVTLLSLPCFTVTHPFVFGHLLVPVISSTVALALPLRS